MHGRGWKAAKAKDELSLPHLSSRADLTRLIQRLGRTPRSVMTS